MTALLLAAALGLAPGAATSNEPTFGLDALTLLDDGGGGGVPAHPALLVLGEVGAGLGAGLVSMPVVHFLSVVFGGFGLTPVLSLPVALLGSLVLPPALVAGAVWAIAELDPIRAPRFRPTVTAALVAWAVVLVAGSVWHEGFWNFVLLTPEDSVTIPLAMLPYLLLGSAVLTAASTVAVNTTTTRRTRRNYWDDPRDDEEDEDPFAQRPARPSPERIAQAPAAVLVPMWLGRF